MEEEINEIELTRISLKCRKAHTLRQLSLRIKSITKNIEYIKYTLEKEKLTLEKYLQDLILQDKLLKLLHF
jgi:hypothetical protein